MTQKRKTTLLFITAIILLAGTFFSSLLAGKYPLTLGDIFGGNTQAKNVFMTLRLPRTLLGIAGGFGLGIAGYVYQTIFRNPLASPDIIGVSSGASAGAAFGILFLSGTAFPVTFSAFAGGLAAVFLALAFSTLTPGRKTSSLVLSGIAVHSLAQTFLMFLKLCADPEKELASIEYWIMGSLNSITLYDLPVPFLIFLLSLLPLFLLHRQIILLSVEEDEAQMLGVSVGKMRLLILLCATLLVASIISLTGLISFIGLLAPHIGRLLLKQERFSTLVFSGICGSILLGIADILARCVAASELPVSIFTSLLGAPFLLFLLIRRGNSQ